MPLPVVCSAETHESTISFHPEGLQRPIWNESTSSFRYPCLVHVFPLCRHKAWTISSSSLAVLRTFLDATNLSFLRIADAIWCIRISANNPGQHAHSDYELIPTICSVLVTLP